MPSLDTLCRVFLFQSLLWFTSTLHAGAFIMSPVGFKPQEGYEWLTDTGSAYGCSGGKVYHPGVDLSEYGTSGDHDKGEPLYAIADGEVVFADDSQWAGLIIRFSYSGRDYYAVYGHSEINSGSQEVLNYQVQTGKTLKTFTSLDVGDRVVRGQIVALLWDHHTDGAHLHFEIRSSDHPSPSNGSAFCSVYSGKSTDEIKRMNRDPLAFVASDGFIDGTCQMMNRQWLEGVYCWTSNPVGQHVSCGDGANHVHYTVKADGRLAVVYNMSSSATQSYCSHLTNNALSITKYLGNADSVLGGDMGGWTGLGVGLGAIESQAVYPPDLIISRSWLESQWGQESYKYGMTERITLKAQSENIGDGDPITVDGGPIKVHFYLSKGYKEDAHSDWRLVGEQEIQPANLEVGETHTETDALAIDNQAWNIEPGIWNIVVCVDHPYTDHNNGGDVLEQHESNNCSTEAVFEVVGDAVFNTSPYDFVITSVALKDAVSPMPAGSWYGARLTVKNQGVNTPGTGIRSNYQISGPGTGNQWQQIADDGTDANQLVPGAEVGESMQSLVQAPSVAGAYRLRACADSQGQVGESDEANNCLETTFEVSAAKPDFIITYIGMGDSNDTSIRKGNTKYPTMRIKNVGTGGATVGIRSVYYFYGPSTGYVWKQIADDGTDANELCVGCEVKERIDSGYSASKTGIHYLKACADYQGAQIELDEGNNCLQSSPITVK